MATLTIEIDPPMSESWDEAMCTNATRAAFMELYGARVRVRVLKVDMGVTAKCCEKCGAAIIKTKNVDRIRFAHRKFCSRECYLDSVQSA
jgi:hypothetical protein